MLEADLNRVGAVDALVKRYPVPTLREVEHQNLDDTRGGHPSGIWLTYSLQGR